MAKSKYDLNNMRDENRKKDHLYSDILGTGAKPGEKGGLKPSNDLVLSTNDWSNTNVKGQINKDHTGYSTRG
jgi:hypothetical protein